MFVKAPEKLFTKVVLSKGYGFNTPQDGSVCKIKVIQDEANLLSGLDEDQVKVIIIGDVDEYIERIIEDCLRTMKENEECSIEFMHPENNTLVDNPDDKKSESTDKGDFSENANGINEGNSGDTDCHSESLEQIASNEETQNTSELEPQGNDNTETTDVPSDNTKEINAPVDENDKLSNLVKIQFLLLSYTTEPEIWEMSVTEKWRRASYHKERGLELYARGMYQYAFRRFGLTLKYVISLEHDVPSGEEGMDIKGLKLSCYLNIAACQMRHHNFESVVKNSTKALNLQPNNAKALYRRGSAYVELQEYEKAQEDLLAAHQLEPKNQAIARQLQILKSRVQKLNQYYASAMKKMFS